MQAYLCQPDSDCCCSLPVPCLSICVWNGWIFDFNQSHALPLDRAGLDACCLGDATYLAVYDGFLLERGQGAPSQYASQPRKLHTCSICGVDKDSETGFSRNQLKKKGKAKCIACAKDV